MSSEGHTFQERSPAANPLGERAAVRPLPSARETPEGPVRGNPRKQPQAPHPCPSTLALKPVLPHSETFIAGAGAGDPDVNEALSWWAGR